VEQKEVAKAFTNYKPYPFQMPIAQRIANWVNCLSLIAALFFLILYAVKRVFPPASRRRTIDIEP
jgi:hypothetical protein